MGEEGRGCYGRAKGSATGVDAGRRVMDHLFLPARLGGSVDALSSLRISKFAGVEESFKCYGIEPCGLDGLFADLARAAKGTEITGC